SGSRSGTCRTVYCQSPAHSGPLATVIRASRGSSPEVRRTKLITWLPLGRPAQSTAAYSPKVGAGDALAVGSGVGPLGVGALGVGLRLGLGTGAPRGRASSGGLPQPVSASAPRSAATPASTAARAGAAVWGGRTRSTVTGPLA